MTVTASVRAALSVSQAGANAFSGGPNWSAAIDEVLSFANGTGANQCDLAYVAERTVASATNDDIDLAGVLTDALGATITAAELVAILIINKQKSGAANTTDLTIGLGTNPILGFLGGTLPTIGPLKPGAVFLLASPGAAGLGAVSGGSADVLRVANSSGAQAKYQIAVLARSA
jgi:hypothetical protein